MPPAGASKPGWRRKAPSKVRPASGRAPLPLGDRAKAERRLAVQEIAHLRLAFLRLQRTDAIDQPSAGTDAPGRGVEQADLKIGELGQVGRLGGPKHIGMTPKRAGGGTGRVEQDGVEQASIGPVCGVGRHKFG